MQIIILGAGQVGSSLAAYLVTEKHSVTVVDSDAANLEDLQSHFDLQTVQGIASHPSVLAEAGADEADMLIAVTNCDEINMIACQVAHSLFGITKKIARIRSQDYFVRDGVLFDEKHIPIDIFISPERLITQGLQYLIRHPGSLRVLDFAGGKVKLIAVRPAKNSAAIGKKAAEISGLCSERPMQIAGVFQGKQSLPIDSSVLRAEDLVFFITASPNVSQIISVFQPDAPAKNQNIMIFGANRLSYHLAGSLENQYHVKLIEKNLKHATEFASLLKKTIVLHGEGSQKDLLINENISSVDVFCALSDDDEDNIVSCLQAKQLGAKQVIALVNRPAYMDLIESGAIRIDVAISAQQSTVGAILAPMRRGNFLNIYSIRHGIAEAIELVVENTQAAGRALKDLKFRPEIRLGAVTRGNTVLIPDENTVIETNDHLIFFISDKRWVSELRTLFHSPAAL